MEVTAEGDGEYDGVHASLRWICASMAIHVA